MTIQNSDLIKEIGEEQLLELSDLDGAYTLNQPVIDDAITDSISFINSFFPIPLEPTPLLQKIAIDLAILNLRRKNGLYQEEQRQQLKSLEGYLLKMAKGSMPTTLSQQELGTKTQKSYAFKTSKRILPKGRR